MNKICSYKKKLLLSLNILFISSLISQDAHQIEKNLSLTDQLYKNFEKQLYGLLKGINLKNFQEQAVKELQSQSLGQKASIISWPVTSNSGEIDPSTLEGQFIRTRLNTVQKGIKEFSGYQLPIDELPHIACAFSGGGYRAMIFTSGFLKALEDMKLLSSIMYISTLSGSTWCVGPWTLLQKPDKKVQADLFRMLLIEKANQGKFDLFSQKTAQNFSVLNYFNNTLWPKFVFGQPMGSVDLYGGVLAHVLLDYFPKQQFSQHLSSQWYNIKDGQHPWPLYTAISMYQQNNSYTYQWYEFNPEYIINKQLRLALPSFAFGRTFKEGNATNFAPEQSFGLLMGIFGSAYTINVKDILRIYFDVSQEELNQRIKLEKVIAKWFLKSPAWALSALKDFGTIVNNIRKGKINEAWKYFAGKVKSNAQDALDKFKAPLLVEILRNIPDLSIAGITIKLTTARAAPCLIANPFKDYKTVNEWLSKRDYLTFIDAGIDYNIPLLPLFDPERKVSLILVGDASGDLLSGPIQLNLAFEHIKKIYGLSYKKDTQKSDTVCSVYLPEQTFYPGASKKLQHVHPPLVIHINFLKDPNAFETQDLAFKMLIKDYKLESFNPKNCLSDFCGTFNFKYSAQQVNQMSGIAEFNVKTHQQTIHDCIDTIIERTRKDVVEFGS